MRLSTKRILVVTGMVMLGFTGLHEDVAADDSLSVDGARLNASMDRMKSFGGNANGGSDRIAFSVYNKQALDYLAGLMREAGLEPQIDVAGNLVGRREGQNPDAAPLVTGSHIDTVPNGGHYDGIVGVMAAIEVARTLHDSGIWLVHPLEVAVWTNEEAGKVGSRSWAGTVEPREMALTALGDITMGDGIRALGGDPARLAENAKSPGDVAGYIELHVEQGAVLDREGLEIGVVTGIVGIRRWNITVEGFANHAGTTPMDQRQDALFAAAQLVTAVHEIVTGEPGTQVGTVGRMHVAPGAPNVVPGTVTMSLEIRDLDMAKIERLYSAIKARSEAIGAADGVRFSFSQYYLSPAALSDPRISAIVHETAERLSLTNRHMPSGAGHDAQSFKDIAPLGMIFVPSVKGVSHAPDEFTTPKAITDGANMLLHTLVGMDARLD